MADSPFNLVSRFMSGTFQRGRIFVHLFHRHLLAVVKIKSQRFVLYMSTFPPDPAGVKLDGTPLWSPHADRQWRIYEELPMLFMAEVSRLPLKCRRLKIPLLCCIIDGF